jgi:hypothetical protein
MGSELVPDTTATATVIPNPLPISAAALPLPAGAATAAGQVLPNPLPISAAALPLPAGAATAAGQVLANPLPVSAAALPLPAGAATEATLAKVNPPVVLSVTVTGGANAIATATLPAVAGAFHYITHISIRRVATAALAGGLVLAVTSTNLGGRSWRTGNQASITVDTFDGGILVDQDYAHPLRSDVLNTATTIVCPAPGLAVAWQIVVDYYTAA